MHKLVHLVNNIKYFNEYNPWIGYSEDLHEVNWIPLSVSPNTVSCDAKSPLQDNTNLLPILLISILSEY